MKKTFVIIAIVSTLLAGMLAGCRAASPLPGVTAIQSAIPTLPFTSPSPATSFGGITSMSPAATYSAAASPAVLPTTNVSAGAS